LGDGGSEESADESEVKATRSFEGLETSAEFIETKLFHGRKVIYFDKLCLVLLCPAGEKGTVDVAGNS
jgi:hypothetical protein